MSFFKDFAKGIASYFAGKVERLTEFKQEAEMADDDKLVSMLNTASGERLKVYMSVAKKRGTIGRSNGLFYVR